MGNVSPLVSIVIPSFNKPGLLIEMIDSIKKQTYHNWELYIIDDGSDDSNYQKVQEFINSDKRCFLKKRYREPKNGDTCRNIGMDYSRGDFLLIFDSDDIISPKCIETRVRYMLAHPNCDYASFPFAKFHDGNKDFLLSAKKEFNIVKQKDILPSLLRVDYPFTVWSNIYRMSSVSNLRWDERVYVYQDFDFMVNCALMNLRHDYCNSPVDYYYRLFSNGDNVCGNFVSQQKCDSTLYLFNKVLLKLETREDEKYLKRCYTDFILKHIERLMADNKKEETDRFIKMLSAHYPCFYITRLRLTYRIASHFTSFAVRRNLLFTLFVILFFKFNYISRIFAHFSR